MSSLFLGQDASGRPVTITTEQRRSTHMHVIGGTRTGKSKFLEWLIRRDARDGQGFCLIDWHGTLYDDVLRYFAYQDIGLANDPRSVILLNFSHPDFISGFNPFVATGGDISVQVSRRVDATIRPWGMTNTNETPTLARIAALLYTFMIVKRETLINAATLLHYKNKVLREFAAESMTNTFSHDEWEELQGINKLQDWKNEVLSMKNRLMRFVGSTTVRRFMGLQNNNIDLMDAMNSGKIILVNLGASDYLDREAARLIASLLLNQFFETAMRRATMAPPGEKPSLYPLYLDEFQEYITEDVAAMLDQVLKGGLHMVLAHQHLGHFADNIKLQKSVFTNARIRAVFGGLDYGDASLIANEMFLPDLNSRQIKKAYYHTIHLYDEQTRTVRGHTSTRGHVDTGGSATGLSGPTEGWFGGEERGQTRFETEANSGADSIQEADSESELPVWVPIPVQELGSETEWSREEKVSRVAEMLKCQQQRHCFIKLDTEKTQPMKVPFVRDFGLAENSLNEYEGEIYERQGALPAIEVDRQISASEKAFRLNLGQVELVAGAGASDDDSDFMNP